MAELPRQSNSAPVTHIAGQEVTINLRLKLGELGELILNVPRKDLVRALLVLEQERTHG